MRIRCSSLGKVMTNPRSKSEGLSETCKTYLHELALEKIYGIKKDFWNKYIDKGLQVEDEAIQLAAEALDWDFVVKNEERFKNDYITGEPDILTDGLLADVKSSWDGSTFPFFDKDLKNKSYFWQMQGYMWLTDKQEAELVYCLVNTPFEIVEDEVRRAHWKASLIDEDDTLRKAVESQHNFDHLPIKARVKRFIVKRDEKAIEAMKTRIEECREYYETIKNQIQL